MFGVSLIVFPDISVDGLDDLSPVRVRTLIQVLVSSAHFKSDLNGSAPKVGPLLHGDGLQGHSADFPRTELRLWQGGPAPNGAPPALVVYYLGVPDTTPEVALAADLDRSLSARIARARDPANKAP